MSLGLGRFKNSPQKFPLDEYGFIHSKSHSFFFLSQFSKKREGVLHIAGRISKAVSVQNYTIKVLKGLETDGSFYSWWANFCLLQNNTRVTVNFCLPETWMMNIHWNACEKMYVCRCENNHILKLLLWVLVIHILLHDKK